MAEVYGIYGNNKCKCEVVAVDNFYEVTLNFDPAPTSGQEQTGILALPSDLKGKNFHLISTKYSTDGNKWFSPKYSSKWGGIYPAVSFTTNPEECRVTVINDDNSKKIYVKLLFLNIPSVMNPAP